MHAVRTQNPTFSFAFWEGTGFIRAVACIGEQTRARNRRAHRDVKGSHHAVARASKAQRKTPFPQARLSATAASSSDETEAPRRRPRTALV